jgi:potassium-dependent mechanosensitive channel
VGDNCQSMQQMADLTETVPVRQSSTVFPRALVLVLTAAALWIPVAAGQQPGGSTSSPKAPGNPLAAILKDKPAATVTATELPTAMPEPAVIPLPDVAARSQVLAQALRDAAATLPTRDQIAEIQSAISELEPSLTTKRQEVNALLSTTPNSLEIREEENYWRGIKGFTANWQQQLLNWANSAQTTISMLDAQEPAWAGTLAENKDNHELGPVLAVIESNLADMRQLRKQAQETLQVVVNLQIKVANFDQTADDVVSQLIHARTKLKGHLLDRDSLPLWKVSSRRELGETSTVFRTVSGRWISIVAFLQENRGTIVFLSLLFAGSLLLARRLHQVVSDKQPTDALEADAYRALGHWFAVGLLPPLILGYVLAPSVPVTLLGFVILISFFPILIILPPLLTRRLRLLLYAFAAIYAFNWGVSWLSLNPVSRREIQFVTNATLCLVLGYLVRPSSSLPRQMSWWGRLILLAVRAAVVVLVISLLSDLFGYMKLAHYLGLACVYGGFVGLSALTAVRVATLLFAVGLRSPVAERIAAVRLHRDGIVRWVPRVLKWIGVVIWFSTLLDLLGIEDGFASYMNSFLGFRIAGSSSGATVGGVFGFFLILAGGYAIASAVRFFFREEVFRRIHMSRGLPELIASVIYYLLMLIVFLAAINAGGIELNKFTVLTGAFGVGIGFGLQNIINNFVSGLILQFERPVHINDIIEVDADTGKVTRIGIRSSTIQTFQGAEVIVPNANLISGKVINWTLSESQRRRELPVGVAYGSDPKVVLRILREAASKHELVLSKPEPMAYFRGFGDSALNFELHFWVMQENNGMQITSEVALAAMEMFDDARIEIPFPQRDLHLRSIDPNAAALLPTSEAGKLLSPDAGYEPVARELGGPRNLSRD